MDSNKLVELRTIAREVDLLLRRPNGLEQFRHWTRQAASEYLAARSECQSREDQRLDLLKKSGVLSGVEALPKRPDDDREWVVWSEIIHGAFKKPESLAPPELPSPPEAPNDIRGVHWEDATAKQRKAMTAFEKRLKAWHDDCAKANKAYILAYFQFVKKLGFPTVKGFNDEFAFDLQCWIPVELSPKHDRNFDLHLPVPKRKLTPADKFAGLSALYDAWFSGAEKIAPWGTEMPNKAEVLSGLTHEGVSKDQFQQANWYYLLVLAAEKLDLAEIPMVESWLADVKSELAKGKLVKGKDDTPLTKLEEAIVEVCTGRILKNADIKIELDSIEISVEIGTIKDAVRRLIDLGVLHRPRGERNGTTKKIEG